MSAPPFTVVRYKSSWDLTTILHVLSGRLGGQTLGYSKHLTAAMVSAGCPIGACKRRVQYSEGHCCKPCLLLLEIHRLVSLTYKLRPSRTLLIASNCNTLRGHQTEFRLLHVKRLISYYAQVVIVARTTEWPLALADQGGPADSTVQLL